MPNLINQGNSKGISLVASHKNKQILSLAKYPPSSLVQLFSPDDWEGFIEDCCRVNIGEGKKYKFVQKIGGAGDAGRDIEARFIDLLEDNQWDLYQAKQYGVAIGESILYPELAKMMYHIGCGTYPEPRNYYICAPKNTTPTLHDLIANPMKLKERFLDSWKSGKKGIDTKKFPFIAPTSSVALAFDYSKIREFPVKDLIDLHSKNLIAHEALFGVEHSRGENPPTPQLPTKNELVYVNQLIKVYSEHSGNSLTVEDALQSDIYNEHFGGCRGEFYSAEGLKRFSRDVLPGEFDNLQESVLKGIKRISSSPLHKGSMEKLEAVLDAASKLQISDNPLSKRLLPADLPGTCHQLVNEEKLKWVK
ncbi:ABC-three component system protein [Aeromonas salmonicida]|uniref:ABC-three component system protein n=1 Tax=Aeromonas salmonicida TaxID=645 RepID=UPI00232FD1C7|nr:ABC-three component system protein [Aeromonas salmonicida]WCH25522.1 hypothetical protein ONZ66_13125 [Aeromonas salmonicida]